jgi:chromosome segregation ATPase
MRIPAWKPSKGISGDRSGGSLPPDENKRLLAKMSDATVEASSAAKRAVSTNDKTIASLELIGAALTALRNRIALLERRSSETNETFENLRLSVAGYSQSAKNTSGKIDEFGQRLTIVAKYAVALNEKITDLAAARAAKDEVSDAVDGVLSDKETKVDKAQSQPSSRTDAVAGLLSNLQASVNDLINRIENVERRITKLEPQQKIISEICREKSSHDVPPKSHDAEAGPPGAALDPEGDRSPADNMPLAPSVSSAPNPAGQEASQARLRDDAEAGPPGPALDGQAGQARKTWIGHR